MKLIAISQRTEFIEEYNEMRDCLDHRWHDFFVKCGIVPILIPNHLTNTKHILSSSKIDGVILTGGNDSPARGEVESHLIRYAIHHTLPILGICHGMQAIQREFNIPIISTPGHITAHQEILINNSSAMVNSYHELGTFETTNDLNVFAKSYDGVIKGIYHTLLPIIGIMWHPERFAKIHVRDIMLVTNLFTNNYNNNEIWRNVCAQLF